MGSPEFWLLAGLFVLHLVFVYLLGAKAMREMTSLAELRLVHQKAKTIEEAVAATVMLEAERDAIENPPEPKEPPKRPIGFKDKSGRLIRFMTHMDDKALAKIPKERLVYQ